MKPVVVGISEFRLAWRPVKLVTYGLGSCVAVVLFARDEGIGSMAHIMLPMAYGNNDTDTPGKFADTAVAGMVRMMEQQGISPPGIVAKITGGADMFAGQFKGKGRRIGARNILAARKALDNFGIRLVAQDVGGTVGRSVEFMTDTGVLTVRTLRGGMKEL
ncbi:MAG: chemotaxis protein CheD [bacterium]|nr:chemotaxis protein CheD [bacterium]MDT8396020.1 chemotaxis protein CheD [bacterium]